MAARAASTGEKRLRDTPQAIECEYSTASNGVNTPHANEGLRRSMEPGSIAGGSGSALRPSTAAASRDGE